MRRRGFLSLFLALALGGLVSHCARAETAPITATQWQALLDGNCSFAVDAYRQLRSSEGNLFFSPYSISTALALVYGGARGETEKQIAKALHFSLDQSSLHLAFSALQTQLNAMQERGRLKLLVANSLWPQQDYRLLDTYLALAKERYAISITPVDYQHAVDAARQQINLWVENKTEQKIKDLIQPGVLNGLTRLVLVNAIYFNARWTNPFDPRSTSELPFQVAPEKTIQVPTMTQMSTMGYAESQTLQVLSLPYVGGSLSMLVLLPRDKTSSLQPLENELSVDTLKSWTQRLRQRRVIVLLPTFRVTKQFLVNGVLQTMGMTEAFRFPGADLSGMTGTRELSLSAVIHKAFIDVDEKGTEAAAATAGMVTGASVASTVPLEPPVVFCADHPFLFLIQDNSTGSILFLGRLTDPTRGG